MKNTAGDCAGTFLEHSGEGWRLGRTRRRPDMTNNFCCRNQSTFVYSTLTQASASHAKTLQISLSFQVDIFVSFFHVETSFSSWIISFPPVSSRVRNVINKPSHSLGLSRTFSCCDSDILQGSRKYPEQLSRTFKFTHTAPSRKFQKKVQTSVRVWKQLPGGVCCTGSVGKGSPAQVMCCWWREGK